LEIAVSQQPVSGDTVVIEHEAVDRLANIVVTVVPVALLGLAIWLAGAALSIGRTSSSSRSVTSSPAWG
jgi:hypothetical protein